MGDRKPLSSDEMEIPRKDDDNCEDAPQDQCEESDRNLATFENQVLPSGRQDTGENDDEMDDPTERNDLIIDYEDASQDQPEDSVRNPTALENQDMCSVGQDASENQQPSSGKSTETSPKPDPTACLSMPVLDHSDRSIIETKLRDASSSGVRRNIDSISRPELYPHQQVTRSLSIQNSAISSPKKQSIETGVRGTPAKRKRTESDSDESGNTKSCRSNLSPSPASTTPDKSRTHEQRRKRKAATPDSEVSEPFSLSPTSNKQKRQRTESSSSDSDASSSPIPATDSDPESPTETPTESNIQARNSGESETDQETSTSIRKGSTDSESVADNSDAGESRSQISIPEESDTWMDENIEENALFSSEESQSASDVVHSKTETQMLGSSHSMPLENPHLSSEGLDSVTGTYPPCRIFSNPHLPEQSNASNMIDPHQVFEPKSYDAKETTDINGSDASTRTSKSCAKSRLESEASLPSVNIPCLELLKSPENPDQEVPMEDNIDMPLLHKQSESTSRHQSQIADDSCADDFSNTSADVAQSGDTSKLKTSDERISKRASDAQQLLLLVLEDIMKFNEEKNIFRRFRDLFHRFSEFSCYKTEFDLYRELMFYIYAKQAAREDEDLFTSREMTLEYQVEESYGLLNCLVVSILLQTVTVTLSLEFGAMMMNYRSLRNLFEDCREFWSYNKVRCIQDEASRNRVAYLKEKLEKYLLQTKHAFQLLLMHIGEHAKPEDIDEYEKALFEEDKSYLRRQIR